MEKSLSPLVPEASSFGQSNVKRDEFKRDEFDMRQSLGPLVHKASVQKHKVSDDSSLHHGHPQSKQTELYKAAAILVTCLFLVNGITYSVIEYGILGNSPHPNQEKKFDEFDIKYSDIVQSTKNRKSGWA